ncbi:hypothetical protein [Thalassomonas sp. RHCl1]|uniref:hypothetical protein n=1 Tax=Thalassomonas sp. RHCl1 TaxID=2995320 RepID=UPI00248A9BC4|nr:hypothetical protein [Thalassomonas sp. RHCl1]
MTKSDFLDIQKSIATKIRNGTLVYAGLSLIVVVLSSFALSNGFVSEELKLLTISGVIAVTVISQVLALKRIRKLNKSISLDCDSCKSQISAEKLVYVVDNGICPLCDKSPFCS